jgi:hypothetical protein
MALTNFQFSNTPSLDDQPFFNYTAVDIPAFTPVSPDTVNVLGGLATTGPLTGTAVQGVSVVPVAAIGNVVIGVTMEIIKAGNSGRVRALGPLVPLVADGAIVAGVTVDASSTAGRSAKSHTAAKFQIGVALSTAADADPVLVMLLGALNA